MLEAERVLAGLVPSREDMDRILKDGWYRIRDEASITVSSRWPPKWFAAFESVRVDRAQQIRYYAPVIDTHRATRSELFPGEQSGPGSERAYQVLRLGRVVQLPRSVTVQKPRRTTFIETTLEKLLRAVTVNDLFNDSTYEDDLWEHFGVLRRFTERQWPISTLGNRYFLDFAVFCRDRNLNVEVDGRQHHLYEDRSVYDAERDTDLNAAGWSVNRFTTAAIRDDIAGCISAIRETIERCGGLEGVSPPMGRSRRTIEGPQMSFPEIAP